MNQKKMDCFFCDRKNIDGNIVYDDSKFPSVTHTTYVECPTCGYYFFQGSRLSQHLQDHSIKDKRYLLSGFIKNKSSKDNYFEINPKKIVKILDNTLFPEGLLESIDLILLHVDHKSETINKGFQFKPDYDYPIAYAKDPQEFSYFLHKAKELKYLEDMKSSFFRIDIEGWKRVDQLRRRQPESNKAFVAMWFLNNLDDSKEKYKGKSLNFWKKKLDDGYSDGIEKALRNTGYKYPDNSSGFRIDSKEHNNNICDEIIAGIRKSRLVIADLTGQRQGVYYEAGFAKALGREVILTCHDMDFGNRHFDLEHNNTIRWKTPEELEEKIRKRIEGLGLDHTNNRQGVRF